MGLRTIVPQPCIDAMKRLALTSPAGAFAEVGVYQGGSAAELYTIAQAQHRELHLFDTFRGMPVSISGLDYHKRGEFADVNLPTIMFNLPEAKFHVGIFPQTLPQNMPPLAFIHCDCDQYESYKAVIAHLWPLLVPGGRLLFDDYPYLLGAKKAVEETFDQASLLDSGSGRYYVEKPK